MEYSKDMETEKMLKTYIRGNNGTPIGTAVVVKTKHGNIRYGYSLCNARVDRFNKKLGTKIAVNRALASQHETQYPELGARRDMVMYAYANLAERARKYFKLTAPF